MAHPIHDLDDVVHQRVRLGILATLIGGDRADFTTLCRGLEVTKGNLGQHLRMLEEAGYVVIDKSFENRRPRTHISVTAQGRNAFARESRALRRLLDLAGLVDAMPVAESNSVGHISPVPDSPVNAAAFS